MVTKYCYLAVSLGLLILCGCLSVNVDEPLVDFDDTNGQTASQTHHDNGGHDGKAPTADGCEQLEKKLRQCQKELQKEQKKCDKFETKIKKHKSKIDSLQDKIDDLEDKIEDIQDDD